MIVSAQIVRDAHEQVTSHQIDVAHLPAHVPVKRRGPHEAGRSIAQQINQIKRGSRGKTFDSRKMTQDPATAPRVPRLVKIHMHNLAGKINNVSRARAIDVSQPNAVAAEQFRPVEPRR